MGVEQIAGADGRLADALAIGIGQRMQRPPAGAMAGDEIADVERSQPFQNKWFFHYTVRITNEGDDTVQLLSRHWIATDATGKTEEVKGSGVVGEQPVLAPGETFQYTSGWGLNTSNGLLRGTYLMVSEEGNHFDVEIAPVALHEPYTVH